MSYQRLELRAQWSPSWAATAFCTLQSMTFLSTAKHIKHQCCSVRDYRVREKKTSGVGTVNKASIYSELSFQCSLTAFVLWRTVEANVKSSDPCQSRNMRQDFLTSLKVYFLQRWTKPKNYHNCLQFTIIFSSLQGCQGSWRRHQKHRTAILGHIKVIFCLAVKLYLWQKLVGHS